MQLWQLIVSGVMVHLVLFYSIFDIYFTTPLVHGMTPIKPPGRPPAKRLFLFVADGLRADKFFEPDGNGQYRAPYLRNIMEESGVWGVSHTRVPTESRPGHVALIAGFYEDVSAIAKGWKENPVEFDSVFNETKYTWSWGSPDILPMFATGASGKHVYTDCYSAGFEDFAGSNLTMLDTWVFDKVKDFFTLASSNSTLHKQTNTDKVVFFLHLLGVDTHGHSSKPHSWGYLNNIRLVDEGIKKVVDMVEEFYNHDGRNAYIFTSDHGMTDWGSHGAGHDHETLTPFVAWGAGIRQPVTDHSCGIHTDTFCQEWRMEKIKRTDMEQADMAPLMSALIGVPFPVNSVGKLPIDVLSYSTKEQAEVLLANALQILAQYEVKMKQVKDRTISMTFRPFQELKTPEKLQSIKHIRQLIRTGYYTESISETNLLIDKALRGLQYYQTYDRLFLGVSIVLGFVGWMVYILSILTFEHTTFGRISSQDFQSGTIAAFVFGVLTVCVLILLYVQCLPLMCYIYCLLPVFLWYKASGWLSMLSKSLHDLHMQGMLSDVFHSVGVCIVGLEILIFSFYYRELLSVGLVALAFRPLLKLWPNDLDHPGTGNVLTQTDLGWVCSCLLTAVFPLMPVINKDTHYDWILYGGIVAVILALVVFSRLIEFATGFTKAILFSQIIIVAISITIIMVTVSSIQDKQGLPLVCQLGSWSILVLACFISLLTPTRLGERLFSLTLAFLAPYLLLGIAYEVFFYVSLASLLYFWIKMEIEREKDNLHKSIEQMDFVDEAASKDNLSRPTSVSLNMELHDLHRAFVFIFLFVTAFFGTGNIASINSFDPTSVYCFLTVFNPFMMGALLMLKVMIPFLLVTCALRAIQVVTQTPLQSIILIVLIMSDFMGLHFFFFVRDYGSWLEIGTTISHYVIVMTMIIFILVLLAISFLLTHLIIPGFGATHSKITKRA